MVIIIGNGYGEPGSNLDNAMLLIELIPLGKV